MDLNSHEVSKKCSCIRSYVRTYNTADSLYGKKPAALQQGVYSMVYTGNGGEYKQGSGINLFLVYKYDSLSLYI